MSLSGVLRRKGAPAVFSWSSAGVYDPATDTNAGPVVGTLTMDAMEIDGDPDLFLALKLVESENPTLLCKSREPAPLPPLGASVVWGGETYTIKSVKRLAMAGVATAARIVVGR